MEEILRRAIAIDSQSESSTATVEDVYRIAAELGLSSESVDQAFVEQSTKVPGVAGCASASIVAIGDLNTYERHLESSLRSHQLERRWVDQPTWWDQRSGWWPDISRNVTALSVQSSTKVFDGKFSVTMAVPLTWIRLVYGSIGLAAMVATIGFVIANLMGVAFLMMGMGLAAGATYHLRVRRIALCLDDALREAAAAGAKNATIESSSWTVPVLRLHR